MVMAASALAAPVIMLSAAAVVRAAPDSATVGGRFDSGATFDSGYSALAAVTVGKTAYDAVFRVPAPNPSGESSMLSPSMRPVAGALL